MIKVLTYRVVPCMVENFGLKTPTIRIWFEIENSQAAIDELNQNGYKKTLSDDAEIIALPIDLKLLEDEYSKDSSYFDELIETIINIINEPSYGILNIKSNDSRIKELSELMVRCFDASTAVKL